MGRGRLGRGDVPVLGEKADLVLGGDVQDVHAFAGFARECDQALGAFERRNLIAPNRVRTRIAFDA